MVQGSIGNHHPAMPPNNVKQAAGSIELYRQRDPPGEPLHINIDPIPVNGRTPIEGEIRVAVAGLSNGRTGGAWDARRGCEGMAAWH
jgi:hypothetical protein